MKKIISCIIALLMIASLCACTSPSASQQDSANDISPKEEPDAQIDTGDLPDQSEELETQIDSGDLIGPWHLDGKNNDLGKVSELFSGYEEWGATMEIRSDGKISWYIGAIGGSGTYTLDGNHLTVELKQATKDETSEPQDCTMDFSIAAEDEDMTLAMSYEDTTVVWSHGEAFDSEAEGWKADFESSLFEQYGVTPDRYEDLGNGIFQVYVIIEGNSVPYVTVDSATGDYHG